MKYLVTFLMIALVSCPTSGQDEAKVEITTYYFIRHAEKDRSDHTNKDPELDKRGLKRANKWAKYFKNIDLDAVYTTNYIRTQQTAQPTAEKHHLDIQTYDPNSLYSKDFEEATKGKTVLVVGHSNTTPAFVNKILKEDKYEDIDDNDNSKLFIVTISDGKITDKVISIN